MHCDYKNVKYIIKELKLPIEQAANLITDPAEVNDDYVSCLVILSVLLSLDQRYEPAVKYF